jgi:RimJ/RimL family protein N-acetyltransferase
MSIYIESERLVLREFAEADLPALVDIAGQEHITRWCADWKDCGSWVHDWFKGIKWRYSIGDPNTEFILLAIVEKHSGRLIGQINTGCELKDEKPGELSIGYFISKEAANQGYATEAAKAMTQHYFPMNKNHFFFAIIQPDNAASLRVAEKAGFKFVSELQVTDKDSKKETLFHYHRLYDTV